MTAHGSYETVDGRPAVRFERRLGHPVEAVWRAVSEPAGLAHWFPARVEIEELAPGGRLRFEHADGAAPPSDGEIVEVEPPRRLTFTWGGERLRFELEPAGDGTLLRLTHFLSSPEQAARDAAGWHVCLDRLTDHLSGAPAGAPDSEPTGEWREHYEAYQARGLPSGAPVPE
jgi:uncharacterized protein YndB with AHSA1/START domain